jgi:hypothetical protein
MAKHFISEDIHAFLVSAKLYGDHIGYRLLGLHCDSEHLAECIIEGNATKESA